MARSYTKAEGSLFKTGGYGMHVSLDMFFDLEAVQARMDRKTERVFGATGAYTRKAMQRGMRRRRGVSAPGEYPSARPGNPLLRDKIRFGYDSNKQALVIGPALLDRTDREVAAAGMTVPELINYGGTVMRRRRWDPQANRIRRMQRSERPIPWHYRPRPFVALTRPIAERALMENMERFDF